MAIAEYEIGASVYGTDKKVGELLRVAVDPHTKRVTDLVVEKGVVLKEDRIIPVEIVDEVDGDGIHLSISADRVRDYPKYEEADFVLADPHVLRELGYSVEQGIEWSWRYGVAQAGYYGAPAYKPVVRQHVHKGVDPDTPLIGRGTRVRNKSESLGYVDHLLLDSDSGEIRYLVLRRGLLPFRAMIPVSSVEKIAEDTVLVNFDRKELHSLARFTPRPDSDILATIEDRLRAVQKFDLSRVTVSLKEGIARLAGSVRDARSKQEADEIAREVEGVIAVDNEIVTEEELEEVR